MGQILQMTERDRSAGVVVHFDRKELSRLFALHSKRVADGEWRDYAIAQQTSRAVFAVFRHALERPIFTISKIGKPGTPDNWLVASGARTLCRADTLEEALHVFEKSLRPVTH